MATSAVVINTSRSELSRRLQINGLNVRVSALTIFEAEIKHGDPPYESVDDFINSLCLILLKISIENFVIDEEIAQKAVDLLREERGRRAVVSTSNNSILIKNVSVVSQSTNLKHHYNQLLRSVKQLPVFESGQFRLTSVDELNTYDSSIELKCIVFALLRRDPSRIMQYLLEDSTGKVPVQFSPDTNWREFATFENGLYLVEGSYHGREDMFSAHSIGLPPPSDHTLPPQVNTESMEESDCLVIIVSDIHLDDPDTISALETLFNGYDSLAEVPEMFVLVGDFTSKPVDKFEFKDHMKNLVRLICKFTKLIHDSRFVFVPGPNDCSRGNSLCNGQFSSDHFPTSTSRLKHYHLATNPFHLKLRDRSICIYGHPLVSHYVKNLIHSKSEITVKCLKQSEQLVESLFTSAGRMIVSSAHLNAALNRDFLTPLSLFPRVPSLILLADTHFEQHCSRRLYDRVRVGSVTSFSKNNFQFLAYYVESDQLEESQVRVE